jgi:hypothetical protein
MELVYASPSDLGCDPDGPFVHATNEMGGGLRIRPIDPPWTAHILAIFRTKGSFAIVGWLYAGEASSRGVWSDELGSYVVPSWKLHHPKSVPIEHELQPGFGDDGVRVWRPNASPGPEV